jgi:hypothetical protein
LHQTAHAISALDIVTHTPAWVWFVLAGLVWLGLGRTRDRIVGVRRLIVLPLLITALEISSLIETGLTAVALAGLALGAAAGIATGCLLERRNTAERCGDGRLMIRGEWASLVLVVVIFATRYVTAVISTIDAAAAASAGFQFATALLSGLFALIMLTRAALRLHVAYA